MSGMFETGTARYSMHNPDPILHIVVTYDGSWRTWCGGGLATRENTVTGRRCRRCLKLAVADLEENKVEPDEETDLDWYLGRVPVKAEGSG